MLLALGLIALGSLSNFVTFNAYAKSIISIVSHPVAALGLACVLAFLQSKNYKNSTFITFKGIEQSIPIILITGAGGAFGQILKQSELSTILQSTFDTDYTALGLVFTAYVMAMIIKTAQGSSTAALVIASSIIFPLVAPFELNTWQLAVIVSTIGCGAMAVSHANDSYFWVVTKFSDFTVNEGYKKYSLMTLLLSITGLVSCLILFTLVSYP